MFEYLLFKSFVFFGMDVDVEIWAEDNKIHYTKRLWRPMDINVTGISNMSIKEVSEKIEALGINQWKKRYQPEDCFVCDGERWLVKYKDSSRQRKKVIEGDNEYPANWRAFLGTVSDIVGDIRFCDDED